MSIEAMKQALENLDEYYITTPEGQKLVTSLRQAIDAYTLSSKPPGLCMCGEPWRLESVHRKKSPCFDYIEREWVGLTDEEIKPLCDENYIIYGAYAVDFIQSIEAKLKEKNT